MLRVRVTFDKNSVLFKHAACIWDIISDQNYKISRVLAIPCRYITIDNTYGGLYSCNSG